MKNEEKAINFQILHEGLKSRINPESLRYYIFYFSIFSPGQLDIYLHHAVAG
jgi:hypothetical protein